MFIIFYVKLYLSNFIHFIIYLVIRFNDTNDKNYFFQLNLQKLQKYQIKSNYMQL